MPGEDHLLTSGNDGCASETESEYYGDISLIAGYETDKESEYLCDDTIIADYQSDIEPGLKAHPVFNHRSSGNTTVAISSRYVLGKRKANESSMNPIDSRGPTIKKSKLVEEDTLADHSSPEFIAYSRTVQRLIDKTKLSRGVWYELARLITTGDILYEDITLEKLTQLCGLNKDVGPRVAQVFSMAKPEANEDDLVRRAFAEESAANSPWAELDREEEALNRGPYEGLGNNPNTPDWYGGKVQFCGKVRLRKGTSESYKIELERCKLGPSSRFSRRFGSWSFLRVKVPKEIFYKDTKKLLQYFKRPFVIWGQVFRACYAKDDNVFFFLTNELFPFGPTASGRMSFLDFITWHNPLEYNSAQLMTKWAARTPLGFSNSVPGPPIRQEDIFMEKDIVSEANSDMTDGCGLSSKSLHRFLLNMLSLPAVPTAFQFRLAGFKGMSLLREDASSCQDEKLQAWFRPSQTKIKYAGDLRLDPAMLTFDILRTSHLRTPSRLSTETIINLAENGVPHSAFVRLLKDGIREIVQGLTTWDGPDAMFKLWVNVERAGGVLAGRRAREAVGEARVRGYSNRSPEEEDDDGDDDDEGLEGQSSSPHSKAWWTDQISGCPSSLEETVLVLLDAGFVPQSCPILREKLKQVVQSKIRTRLTKYRFDLDHSCVAFAVPDPYGVLGPNEIHVKSSKRNLKMNDGLFADILLGNVLITRNPCKIPTDIRKVKAVDHPALRNYVDVVVFSVQGHRRWIDFLAGGDYDGDTVLVIWRDLIVQEFRNADEKYASEPRGLDLAFTRDEENGSSFLQRTQNLHAEQKIREMQSYLLGGLVDTSLVGSYSTLHLNAIYRLGYAHPLTIKLAAKFCRVLDAPKTGWRIKPGTRSADSQAHGHGQGSLGLEWKTAGKAKGKKKEQANDREESKERFQKPDWNCNYLKRKQDSPFVKGDFVMDILFRAAEHEKDRLLTEMEALFKPLPLGPDPDLTRPWDDLVHWAKNGSIHVVSAKARELDIIKIHVQEVYQRYKASVAGNFTQLPIEHRQDRLRTLSQAFVSGPPLEDLVNLIPDNATLARVRASYAFKYDADKRAYSNGWSRFPFDVAMRELCAIKAASQGGISRTILNSFYERFKLVEHRQ